VFLRRDLRQWADYYAHTSLDKTGEVFSNPGMSLERPEIDDAKHVDPL